MDSNFGISPSQISPPPQPKEKVSSVSMQVTVFVFIVLVYVASLLSVGGATFVILTHVPAEVVEEYKGKTDFTNLTIQGNFQVKGTGLLQNSDQTAHDMQVDQTIVAGAVSTDSITVSKEKLTNTTISTIKQSARWLRVLLNRGDTMEASFQTTDEQKNFFFPFASAFLDSNKISALGPDQDKYAVKDSPVNENVSFVQLEDSTEGDNGTWLISGYFGIKWGGEIPHEVSIQTSLLGDKLQEHTVLSYLLHDIDTSTEKLYRVGPVVTTVNVLNRNFSWQLEARYKVNVGTSVNIIITRMDFMFKKLM